MGNKSKGLFIWAVIFNIFFLIASCASSNVKPVEKVVLPPPLFPPQSIMQSGDYAGFFKENSEAIKSCEDPDKCTVALFNLSFLYCYPKSPYYDPRIGLKYATDLIAAAPESPWASQAKVWKDMIQRFTRQKPKKHSAQEGIKTKDAATEPKDTTEQVATEQVDLPDDSAGPVEPSQEKDWGADRQKMEEEIKSKDQMIKKLNSQLERSRQIDIEMEEKERGLLK